MKFVTVREWEKTVEGYTLIVRMTRATGAQDSRRILS